LEEIPGSPPLLPPRFSADSVFNDDLTVFIRFDNFLKAGNKVKVKGWQKYQTSLIHGLDIQLLF